MRAALIIREDEFLYQKALDRVLKQTGVSASAGEKDKVSFAKSSWSEIRELCQTSTFFGDARVVIASEFEDFDTKTDGDSFLQYLANPNPECALILISGEALDKRTTFSKKLLELCDIHSTQAPPPQEWHSFLQTEIKARGLSVEMGVVDLLIQAASGSLLLAIQELEKMALFVLPEKNISLHVAQNLLEQGLVTNAFALSDSLAQKNKSEAIALIRRLIEQGEAPHKLLAMVSSHFRRVYAVQLGLQARQSEAVIATGLGVSPFYIKRLVVVAKKFSEAQLSVIYQHVKKATLEMRSAGRSPQTILEDFILMT